MKNKIYLIALCTVCFLLLTISLILISNKNKDLNINGLKINSEDLGNLIEPLEEGYFFICDIPKDECFVSLKQKVGE